MQYSHEEILENRRIWKEALVSGRYQQGHNRLGIPECACCLGVAMYELAPEQIGDDKPDGVVSDRAGHPTKKVRDMVGVDPAGISMFIYWNDNRKLSFEEIAGLIDFVPLPTELLLTE